MCDPLTIAGVALSAGSAVANNAAANQQAKAQAAAMSAERARQSMLDDEARGVNQRAQNRFEDVEGQQAEKASQLTDEFSGEANRGAEVIAAALPRTSSNVTLTNDESERGKASEYADQQGRALAEMRSFADLFGGIGRGMAQDGSELGMIGGFKRGSQGALPFELEAAAQKGGGLRGLADIMGGVGGIATNAGLSGANFPGLGSSMSRGAVSGPMARSPIPPSRPAGLGGLY